jgi:hypothetical protein
MTDEIADRLSEGRWRMELLKMDLELRRKQVFWETPRNLAIVLGAMAAIFAAVFGVLGYKIGQTPAPPPVIINLPAAPAK